MFCLFGRQALGLPPILRPQEAGDKVLLLLGEGVGDLAVIQVQPPLVDQGGHLPHLAGKLHKGRSRPAAQVKDLGHEEAGREIPAVPGEVVAQNLFGGGVSGSVCDRRLDAVKKELRQRALAARNALEKREEKSRQIAAHILESAAYQNTERIFTFVSMGSEVETEEIIRQAWQDGKAVAVPKTEKHREMHFYEIRSLAELSEGRFGVREPKGGAVCVPKEGDLLLVPGLLFDGKKNRLGYGGGYYDTYFAKHKEGKRIGLAFAAQRFAEELPTEETDVPLDAVITENGWEE